MSKVTKSSAVTEKWATHMGLGTKRSTSTGVRYREVPPGDVQGLYRVGVTEVGGGAFTNADISHLDIVSKWKRYSAQSNGKTRIYRIYMLHRLEICVCVSHNIEDQGKRKV